jgi:hypothetical protein
MGQVGSYYNPAAAAYGTLSAASMAAAAAAAAAQQSAISGLSAPAQVRHSDQPHCSKIHLSNLPFHTLMGLPCRLFLEVLLPRCCIHFSCLLLLPPVMFFIDSVTVTK